MSFENIKIAGAGSFLIRCAHATCWLDTSELFVKAYSKRFSQLSQKRRSPAEKYGRYKWMEMLQRRILDRVERMEKRQWLILKGLQHYFVFTEDYVLNVIAETRLDHACMHARSS